MSTNELTLIFGSERKNEYPGGCRLKKVHGRESLALPHTVYRQERAICVHKRCTAVSMYDNHDQLVNTNTYTSTILTGQREAEQLHMSHDNHYVTVFDRSLTIYGIGGWRLWLAVTNCFPINCTVHKSHSLSALDASRCSAFILDFS